MTPGRWIAVIAYLCLISGGTLIASRLYSIWGGSFPGVAGVCMGAAGVLLFTWVRPGKRHE